jgi:DNA-binding MarR family transcriptional regulator
LFGRAREILEVEPLSPRLLPDALDLGAMEAVEAFTAWGGVPRYWELANEVEGPLSRRLDRLVLDPLGALHREPDRLIVEELPPATEVRALLDAIGSGAHKVSEIAGRIGRPATSLGRPLKRLQSMGLVRREVPFGEDERSSKRSLYRIADPFTRLWFRVVAPHRALLATATQAGRLGLLGKLWPQLLGEGWEDLCRLLVPRLDPGTPLGAIGPWGPASRWWRGGDPEWDLVSRSLDGRRLLVGEAKVSVRSVPAAMKALTAHPLPPGLPDGVEIVRAMFVAKAASGRGVVTASELLVSRDRPGSSPSRGIRS